MNLFRSPIDPIMASNDGHADSGMAYVTILLLVVIISSIGVGFMLTTSLRIDATATRSDATQAQYLAESAAQRALWRILNEPGFPTDQTTYTMESLATGRYGYNVTAPTVTTEARIATVGAVGETVAHQSWVARIPARTCLVYAVAPDMPPRYRRLAGANWGPASGAFTTTDHKLRWVRMASCPVRNELICAVGDDANNITAAVWDGAAWGNRLVFATTSRREDRSFDVAYEQNRGRALLAGWNGDGGHVEYNLWTGSGWAYNPHAWSPLNIAGASDIRMLELAPIPGTNYIAMGALDKDKRIFFYLWYGWGFANLDLANGSIETDAAAADRLVMDVACEQISGRPMIAYGEKDALSCRYRIWNGTALSSEGSLPATSAEARIVRLEAAPGSNQIMAAVVNNQDDLLVALWNGASWSDSRLVETNMEGQRPNFDLAWTTSGDAALVVWGPGGTNLVRYLYWKAGTPLSATTIHTGPDFQDRLRAVRLQTLAGTDKMVLVCNNKSKDLRYSFWTGTRFRGNPAILLNDDLSSENEMPFGVATVRGGN